MPIDPGTATVVVGGMNLAGQGLQAALTGATNRKQRKWAEKRYAVERADALADWNMQNVYNSPEQQMLRLKAAGLNPNLVYGSGADAGSVGPVRSSQHGQYSPEVPKVDLGGLGRDTLGTYVDLSLKNQALENSKTTNELMQREKTLKEIEALVKLTQVDAAKVNIDRGKLKLSIEQKMADLNLPVETAIAGLDKTRTETRVIADRNEREAAMNASNLREAVERILKMRAERNNLRVTEGVLQATIRNLIRTGLIQQEELNVWKKGSRPSDPLIQRKIMEAVQRGWDWLKDPSKWIPDQVPW